MSLNYTTLSLNHNQMLKTNLFDIPYRRHSSDPFIYDRHDPFYVERQIQTTIDAYFSPKHTPEAHTQPKKQHTKCINTFMFNDNPLLHRNHVSPLAT